MKKFKNYEPIRYKNCVSYLEEYKEGKVGWFYYYIKDDVLCCNYFSDELYKLSKDVVKYYRMDKVNKNRKYRIMVKLNG